ncbi:MAG: 50S ribosomal protein L18 [Mycoplasmataceae bacterium]|jgi:large subunit ribosomal protein L18|nr:50S ribosomal protein L18 [Mycoplasmataceae bacterium]
MAKNINIDRKANKTNRHYRFLKKLTRDANDKPRLIVTKTNAHIYAQILDPVDNHVLVYVSTMNLKKTGNIEGATAVGNAVAEKAKTLNIENVVFDRNGQKYHGQVKAVADAAREKGLKF